MNVGGYINSDFNESNGNAELTLLLQSDKTIKTHFNENDKTRNDDGYLELLKYSDNDKKHIPYGQIRVQIKTIEKDISNKNTQGTISTYKYSCDTKIFNAVRAGIFFDPAILLLWDVTERRAFYINISYEYVKSLDIKSEEKKMIYFNDANILNDINRFHNHMEKIYKERKDLVIPKSQPISSEDMELLQEGVDYLNDVFFGKLPFLGEMYFSGLWKLGIAYRFENHIKMIAVHGIKKGKPGELIKEFGSEKTMEYYSNIYLHSGQTTREIIKDIIKLQIETCCKDLSIPLKYFTIDVLEEIVYLFLDKVACYCTPLEKPGYPCVYYKDKETVLKLRQIWCAVNNVVIEQVEEIETALAKKGKKLFESSARTKKIQIDLMQMYHVGANVEQFKNRLLELIGEGSINFIRDDIWLKYKGKNDTLVLEAINELEKRGVDIVRRPWKHPDFIHFADDLKGINGVERQETGFKMKDFYANVVKLMELMPSHYLDLIKKLSPKAYHILENKKHYRFKYENYSPALDFTCFISDSDNFRISVSEDFRKDETTISTISSSLFEAICINKPILYTQLTELLERRIREEFNIKWMYLGNLIF